MNYVTLINDAIDYIEKNLNQNVTAEELANKFYISAYYFIRIFKAITNQTVKEYTDKRRLSEAAKMLRRSDKKVVEVAFEYGYESHEVFTRNFKKLFDITPHTFCKTDARIKLYDKIEVVERDFKNKNKDLIATFEIVYQQELTIACESMGYTPAKQASIDKLKPFAEQFFYRHNQIKEISRFYNIASCDRERNSYSFSAGFEANAADLKQDTKLRPITLPESDYAVFLYRRELGEIHTVVMRDICKAIMVSQLALNKKEIDFIVVFEKDYFITNQYAVYVPVMTK